MTYNSAYLSKIAYLGGKAGRRLWFYTTADNHATVAGSGYISDATDQGMEVGDVVIVTQVTTLPHTTPTGVSVYLVDSISSGAATLDKTATA